MDPGIDPSGSEDILPEPRRLPMLSMRAKWAILIMSLWVFMGVAYLTAYDEISSALVSLDQNTQNESQYDPGGSTISYHTFFRDDFDHYDSHWHQWFQEPGSVNFRDGYAFLNITPVGQDGSIIYASLEDGQDGRYYEWLNTSMEVRLRCSDENDAGGYRFWGFGDCRSSSQKHSIGFASYSRESGPILEGFWAQVVINDTIVLMKSVDVNMTQWHNYTILWEPGNVTFLVDNETIVNTQLVPNAPLSMTIIQSAVYHYFGVNALCGGSLMLEQDEWIQVDHAHIFMTEIQQRRFLEDQLKFLQSYSNLTGDVKQEGLDTEAMIGDLIEATRYIEDSGHIPGELYVRMVTALEELPWQLNEINQLFIQARESIQKLEMDGNDTRVVKARFAQAEEAWNRFDFTKVKEILHRIVGE